MKDHYMKIVRACEEGWEKTRCRIVRDPSDPRWCGRTDDCLLPEPGYSVGEVSAPATLYACQESKYYKDTKLFADLIMGCRYLLSRAHEDGTHDLLATNFYTPATFELHSLLRGYNCFMTVYSGTPEEEEARTWMEKVIRHLGMGCVNGGFHTPNHRWVETAALFGCYNIFKIPEMKAKAEKYLAEGIDCDEYGEFTERSTGMYNAVNDNSLMMIAEEADMPELYVHVRKNMDLLFDYIEPDGSIFTQNSRRKDKGEGAASGRFWPAHTYYHLYLWAGEMFGDRRYLKFADEIFNRSIVSGRGVPAPLWLYILRPQLKTFEPDLSGVELPASYSAYYPGSNIYRRREDFFSYSVIANNPNFMFLRCGEMQVYLRMCASFFAVAQFVPDSVEKTEKGCRMTFHSHGEYRLPYDEPQKSPLWKDMDYSKRGVIHPCDLDFTLDVEDTEDGARLHIKTGGTPDVPFKLEFAVSPNCNAETSDSVVPALAGGISTVKHGSVTLWRGDGAEIRIGGCFARHLYNTTMRGSVPQARDCFTVYCTDYSPVDRTVELHFRMRDSSRGELK